MKNKILIGIVAALVALSTWLLGFTHNAPLGSVNTSQGYRATTTISTSASATASYQLCKGSSIFGSIVVVQPASAGYVRVWNATSTATSTYQTPDLTLATSKTVGVPLAQVLAASDVVGTLTFDAAPEIGVVVETSTAFDGQYVVTCKY